MFREGEILIKEAIGVGATVDEARENACRELGVETFETEFEILKMPEKKKLGLFGGSPAKVRVYIEISPVDTAVEYLKNVLDAMGAKNLTVEKHDKEDGVEISIEGEDVGYVIGRRGETLDALQYLTGLVANHVDNNYYRITLNTGNYREKREETLAILGRKLAFKAVKTGSKTSLEPMNPYERRIIHTAVQKVNGAISWSEGENAARHVVIGPDPKAPKPQRRNQRGGKYGQKGRYNKFSGSKKGGFDKKRTDTDKPAVERKPLNEGGATGLYGRIDK